MTTGTGYTLSVGQRVATARRGGRASGAGLYRVETGIHTMAEITARTGVSMERACTVIRRARAAGRIATWADFTPAPRPRRAPTQEATP